MKLPSYLPLGCLALSAVASGGPAANPALFDRAHMAEADLSGLRVWLGKPVEVTSQLAWGTDWLPPSGENAAGKNPKWRHWWSFVHPTPYMARFPEGELVSMYALDPDSNDNPVFVSGYQISKDGGAHWGRRYSVLMEHQAMVFVPQKNDSLLAVQSQMMPQTPGDERNFTGPAYLFVHGGDRLEIIPDGVRIVDLPWPVGVYPRTQALDSWRSQAAITGDVLEVGGKFLATGYAIKKGETLYKSILFASEDGGYTWKYLSTIAEADLPLVVKMGRQDPDDTAAAPLAKRYGFFRSDAAAIVQLANTIATGPLTDATVAPLADKLSYEGPNETSVISLADGDLMAVFRVGEGWNLYRNYSHDGGRTWTIPVELPAYSVFPRLIRAAGGAIALVTGRPGLDLWLSNDPKAGSWQKIDLAAYHNHWETDPYLRITSFPNTLVRLLRGNTMWQTSSYTGVVEAAPNQLLVCYDRCPEIAPSGPQDLSRVYVMPIEIAAGKP